jgi:hypothetical protein
MIASGMVLWTVKRRNKAIKEGGGSFGYRFTEGLNLGCLLGLPSGIATYLLANRLLPLDVVGRAAIEVDSLFIIWGLIVILAVLMSLLKKADIAWVKLTYLTGVLFTLVPIVNAVTTNLGFVTALISKNWVFVAVDLICVMVSILCFVLAHYLKRLFIGNNKNLQQFKGGFFKRSQV